MQIQESPREIQEDLDRFTQDMLYSDEHREELLRQYADRWVAVYHQEVVGAAKNLATLIRQLERKGIQPGRVFREYLTDDETLLIL